MLDVREDGGCRSIVDSLLAPRLGNFFYWYFDYYDYDYLAVNFSDKYRANLSLDSPQVRDSRHTMKP